MKDLFIYLMISCLFIGFVSCDDDKINEGGEDEEIILNPSGFFVLCRGNEGMNNASLGYYDVLTGEYEGNIFAKQNKDNLGELAQEMLIYGEKMYITMSGSNSILVTNLNAKLIKEIKPDATVPMNPRSLVGENGKVFVSYYKGHSVAVLDTTSLSIEKTIPVGRYPEQMTINKGKLYVTNSGGLDWDNELGYDNTVSVINISTLEKENDIIVAENPTKIVADNQDNVYVISMGDYSGDEANALQQINLSTGKITKIGNASLMTLVNNTLYTIYAQYWYEASDIKYVAYDITTIQEDEEEIVSHVYVKDALVGNPYSLNVNPKNGEIYISHFVWQETNDIYVFDRNGNKKSVLESDGYDIAGIWFRP